MERVRLVLAVGVFLAIGFPASGNVVLNGDFEQGNAGFVTEYAYVDPPPAPRPSPSSPYYLYLDGQYTIYGAPRAIHSNFAIFGDHTSGSGNMLIVNAASDSHSPDVHVVWQQTVPVIPYADYVLTYWVSSCVLRSPAQIECCINGEVGGDDFAPATPGVWMEVTYNWNAGPNSEATITLEDLTRQPSGDDFAIDDISLDIVAVPIDIDVKPGSDANTIPLRSRGMVSVAILGSDIIDVEDVDQTTLWFAGAMPREKGKSGKLASFEDVNADGLIDLVAQFPVEELDLSDLDTEATLQAQLYDGTFLEGSDSVQVH